MYNKPPKPSGLKQGWLLLAREPAVWADWRKTPRFCPAECPLRCSKLGHQRLFPFTVLVSRTCAPPCGCLASCQHGWALQGSIPGSSREGAVPASMASPPQPSASLPLHSLVEVSPGGWPVLAARRLAPPFDWRNVKEFMDMF